MRRVVGAVVGVLVLAGCSSVAEETTPAPSPSATTEAEPTPEPTAEATPEPDGTATIATVTAEVVDVFDAADATEPARVLRAEEVVSVPGQIPMTFLVDQQEGEWLRVHLPVRPNGSTGWLRAADVALSETDLRVEVRLSEFRLEVHRGDDVVFEAPIGIGRQDVPTPGGVYYIKELLQPPVPGGTYGAYAYGLSGFSPVLEEFAGGEGVIGIHGTNQPDSIGTEASHGCIRLLDDDVTRLVEEVGLPLGTPVEILA
nr:L,D-transpeptidase family protein [uncultured Actinotalea sp.]